ncbi:type II toxin-antitoxin system RelE/ParE family toxin [Streptomyces sp. NPDC057638]|uniref:type II toxin-antitoxin system RelE family toxin n=1 Tax=Streptomyces sp. NPDC057638 TaxID=3346190 RepID=UPI0036CFCC62
MRSQGGGGSDGGAIATDDNAASVRARARRADGTLKTRPRGAFGSPDMLRIHIGAYRVMYEINDREIRVNVIHLGRVP